MTQSPYEVQFRPLCKEGHCLSFPCDPQGHVDLDSLSPYAMENYLCARAMIGHEFASPEVCVNLTH